jgi:GR25 family glycosyltransferase involved in LPS biosynthesis
MSMFDKVFVVNLDNKVGRERMAVLDPHLKEHDIDYERWDATENTNGIVGLLWSMARLFRHCAQNGFDNVLVFEDDADIKIPFYPFMEHVWPQMPKDYHCLALGTNLLQKPTRYSENILHIKSSYSTHAIVYSLEAMKLILPMIERHPFLAYDILLRDELQPLGKYYCTFPQLVMQRPGYSNIEKKEVDWAAISNFTYNAHTFKL